MVTLVCSCDKNADTFDPFHHCMEKYWPGHPTILYSTETVQNPYYKTVSKNYPISKWTKRIRETLNDISDDAVLLLVDDIFIRKPVDIPRIEYAESIAKRDNVALLNFEKEFDNRNDECGLDRFKKRRKGSSYSISIMCGMWNRKALIDILGVDSDPWFVEYTQPVKDYDYYINSGDYIIDYGYLSFHWFGLRKGKWAREIVPFFKQEGIEIDYSKRGFYD